MIRGGLRTRLIGDSTRIAVIAGLQDLGWFDATVYDTPPGARRHHPLRYIARPGDWQTPIAPNAIAISTEDIQDTPIGLGGEVEDQLRIYIDVFAEDDQVGWHLTQDIRDLLFGKMTGLGRDGPVIDVYDLRLATPAPFTQVDIEDILVDRAVNQAREYQNHWFMLRVSLTDDYSDEFNATHIATDWSDDLAPAWDLIQAVEL